MVKALSSISHFYSEESCGQCTPCREGSGWVSRMVDSFLEGTATMENIDTLRNVAKSVEGRTICAFGEAFAWPVAAFINYFEEEFVHYVKHKCSMVTA